MAIIISPKVRLVIADANTTNLDFATNKATEISILKGPTLDRGSTSLVTEASRVSSTSNRVSKVTGTGFTGVKFSFRTYLKPVTDGGNVTSPEKLLWESLAATDVVDTASTSTVAFTAGNVNKLRELFFYLIFEDNSYYRIDNSVVATVNLNLDINGIAIATWEIVGLDLAFITTPLTETSIKDLTDKIFITNKLSTISLIITPTTYNLAIVSASIKIINSVVLNNRVRVGEINNPSGHYTGDRSTNIEASFYLNDQTDGSSTLINNLLAFTTLDDVNTLANVTISIGGTSNSLKIDVLMPTSKIQVKNPTVGILNTVAIALYPQESVAGLGDEISLVYNN